MYKIKLWDEDKWDMHSSSYNPSKYGNLATTDKGEKAYHEQKYGSEGGGIVSDYIKKDELKEKEGNEKNPILDEAEEQKKEQNISEEEIPFKAAKQVFDEKKYESKKAEIKKDAKTIEDAIKKAIEEEKKVIIMDS